jgi:hypothetical protein
MFVWMQMELYSVQITIFGVWHQTQLPGTRLFHKQLDIEVDNKAGNMPALFLKRRGRQFRSCRW